MTSSSNGSSRSFVKERAFSHRTIAKFQVVYKKQITTTWRILQNCTRKKCHASGRTQGAEAKNKFQCFHELWWGFFCHDIMPRNTQIHSLKHSAAFLKSFVQTLNIPTKSADRWWHNVIKGQVTIQVTLSSCAHQVSISGALSDKAASGQPGADIKRYISQHM